MPSWVKDDDIWKKAKEEVKRKSGMTDDQYYGSVTTVYKNMGGEIMKKEKNMKFEELSKGQVIVYKNKVEVRLDRETVWLTQKYISDLFDIERSVITKHIRNVFKTKELEEKSNVQKIHIANSDKPVKLYNLDVIISIGYRVNSKRGTQFRI